jgi:hypothetical protein
VVVSCQHHSDMDELKVVVLTAIGVARHVEQTTWFTSELGDIHIEVAIFLDRQLVTVDQL